MNSFEHPPQESGLENKEGSIQPAESSDKKTRSKMKKIVAPLTAAALTAGIVAAPIAEKIAERPPGDENEATQVEKVSKLEKLVKEAKGFFVEGPEGIRAALENRYEAEGKFMVDSIVESGLPGGMHGYTIHGTLVVKRPTGQKFRQAISIFLTRTEDGSYTIKNERRGKMLDNYMYVPPINVRRPGK